MTVIEHMAYSGERERVIIFDQQKTIKNPVRTSAVFHELSGETMGVSAVYSLL